MDYNIIQDEVVFNGYFAVNKLHLKIDLYNGEQSDIFTREVFKRGHAVALLPFDIKNNLILMVEQFRIGAIGHMDNPWLIEPIAGIIEKNETSQEVVQREAYEEAGLKIRKDDLIFITKYLVSPGGSTESMMLYAIEMDLSNIKPAIFGLKHENEDIKIKIMDIGDAINDITNNKINNAMAMISLLWLAKHLKKND
ncbi:MAG: ADP-ribose diphosphatase [Gammaproteobacteria bacterium]|nr:MAG: ADP-ribose diphosphatase [Gammaproteobacteria bacterium]